MTDSVMISETTVSPATERAAALFAQTAVERDSLANHPVQWSLTDPATVRRFTEHHVFAVWDFMSLLKSLQVQLTGVQVPWVPRGSAEARRLVNEIVLGEESDVHPRGGHASHFELYLDAMDEVGADRAATDRFVAAIREGLPVREALRTAAAPEPAARFVESTFDLIEGGSIPAQVAAFCLGREVLLPEVFSALGGGAVARTAPLLHAYFERHVEVDGGDHGPAAERLLAEVCGDDDGAWLAAEAGARRALSARRDFWDALQGALAAA